MPAQKRSYDDVAASSPPDDNSVEQDHEENEDKEKEDSDGSSSSSSSFSSSGVSEKEEFVIVKMGDLRKEVQCPICLGIIRKTRTVMECLHRFCRECIDKSMRLGNKECPACRAHCASRRSLRDDPNFDTLIAVLLPDIEKYEEEESAFHEEEKARNKQIQASIAQTSRRQLEALGRKRTARATAAAFERRSQSSYRNLRGRNQKTAEIQDSDNEDDVNGHDGGKDSSSADERSTEVKPKRKRWRGACYSQASLAANSADGVCDDNELEVTREYTGISAALVGGSEMLAWGRGGMRSHTRHGSLTGSNGKNARNARIYKLVNHLQSLPKLEDQLDIHLMLVSLDEQKILSLQEPYIRCRPTWSIRHLCQLVALDTAVQADEVEMLLVKEDLSKLIASQSVPGPIVIDPSKDELHLVEKHETLMDLQAKHNCISHELILAYRRKMSG